MSKEIAQTILNQLGGNRFITMTGAKNLVAGDDYLGMKIGRNAAGINYVKITLNAMDTYDVEYGKVRKYEYKEVASSKGLYADMLRGDFENATGLYTRL